MSERIDESLLADLEAKHAAIENDYRPTCIASNYGSGCAGATDASVDFWRAAVDAMPAMIAELRSRRAAELTNADVEALRILAERNRCAMHGTRCTDVLCAETQAGVAVIDRLIGATP